MQWPQTNNTHMVLAWTFGTTTVTRTAGFNAEKGAAAAGIDATLKWQIICKKLQTKIQRGNEIRWMHGPHICWIWKATQTDSTLLTAVRSSYGASFWASARSGIEDGNKLPAGASHVHRLKRAMSSDIWGFNVIFTWGSWKGCRAEKCTLKWIMISKKVQTKTQRGKHLS